MMESPVRLLEVNGLKKFFPIRRGVMQRVVGHVRAVDDVSFFVEKGECLSLVGESGCGKTTSSRCILRAIHPTAGEILFRPEDGSVVDVAKLSKGELRPLRRQMQMIFQDPFSSLNPRRTLLDIVAEPLVANGIGNRQKRLDRSFPQTLIACQSEGSPADGNQARQDTHGRAVVA